MPFRITGIDWRSVASAAREHACDPFGIGVRWDNDAAGTLVERRVSAALLGEGHDRMVAVARTGLHGMRSGQAGPAPLRDLDAVTADLLSWIGIDPLAYAVLCAFNVENCDIRDSATLRGVERRTGGDIVIQTDGLLWNSGGELRMKASSETIAMGVEGCLLGDFLSHPALDRHVLPIIWSGILEAGIIRMHLMRLDHDRAPLDAEALDSAWRGRATA